MLEVGRGPHRRRGRDGLRDDDPRGRGQRGLEREYGVVRLGPAAESAVVLGATVQRNGEDGLVEVLHTLEHVGVQAPPVGGQVQPADGGQTGRFIEDRPDHGGHQQGLAPEDFHVPTLPGVPLGEQAQCADGLIGRKGGESIFDRGAVRAPRCRLG